MQTEYWALSQQESKCTQSSQNKVLLNELKRSLTRYRSDWWVHIEILQINSNKQELQRAIYRSQNEESTSK